MTSSLKIGLAGLGTVGCGVVDILQTHNVSLFQRTGCYLEITAVSAYSRDKKRPVDVSAYKWNEDPLAIASDENVNCVVEMIGGEDGIAKDLIVTALKNKKHVVTANKALLAYHGYELAKLAEENNVALMYEAAVAGGIPVIKTLKEGFAGNRVEAISGILNGTCNYILSDMQKTGRDFADVLKDAQAKGYAETPPDLDVDGVDAAHKLCLLTALSFGVKPDFEHLRVKGIRAVSAIDIQFAAELGYKIKLLGTANRIDGRILQSVEACLVPESLPIAQVDDVFNAVSIEGDFVGDSLLVGRGAGAGPTASAILSDLVDVATGNMRPVFGIPASELADADWIEPDDLEGRFYLRLSVKDQTGVLADISAILRDHNISIESFIQHGRNPEQPVTIVIISHDAVKRDIKAACQVIAGLPSAQGEPHILRIE